MKATAAGRGRASASAVVLSAAARDRVGASARADEAGPAGGGGGCPRCVWTERPDGWLSHERLRRRPSRCEAVAACKHSARLPAGSI